MAGCTVRQYEQLDTSPETIEQELRPAVCEHRQTDRPKDNYSIDIANSNNFIFLKLAQLIEDMMMTDMFSETPDQWTLFDLFISVHIKRSFGVFESTIVNKITIIRPSKGVLFVLLLP